MQICDNANTVLSSTYRHVRKIWGSTESVWRISTHFYTVSAHSISGKRRNTQNHIIFCIHAFCYPGCFKRVTVFTNTYQTLPDIRSGAVLNFTRPNKILHDRKKLNNLKQYLYGAGTICAQSLFNLIPDFLTYEEYSS